MPRITLFVAVALVAGVSSARGAPPRALRGRISRLRRRLRARLRLSRGRAGGRRASGRQAAPDVLASQTAGDLSTAALLAASGAKVAPLARSLSGVGSVALGLHAGRRLTRAKTHAERAER